jgi:hypothetical protein
MERTFVSYVVSHLWAAVALVTAALSTTVVLAQSPTAGQNEMAAHKQMMAEQKGMMAEMTAADQKIADLVAKMNAAKGEERIAAMAAVVNELVAQRKQMRESCGMMMKAPTAAAEASEPDHGAHHPQK